MPNSSPHSIRPNRLREMADHIAPDYPASAEDLRFLADELIGLYEQLEALRASVEIVQSERDEAVGKLRSLGLAVVDAMCDQSSTCRATEHKPWCFGYQPAYGIGGNLPGAESTPATNASEPVEATQGPSTDGNPSSHPGSEASDPAKSPEDA